MAEKLIKMSDVPAWIEHYYGMEPPTRQTVYNWRTKGKNGNKLRAVRRFGNYVVSEKRLHEFATHL
jgi:hypothetical protein